MTMRRDPLLAVVVGIVFLGTMPAWDRVFEDTTWRAPTLLAALGALVLASVLRRLRLGLLVSLAVSGIVLLSLAPWLIGATPRPMMPTANAWAVLSQNLSQALIEIEETRAPAPSFPGLVLTLVLGAWSLTHVSHELLVRWRRPALAAIPFTAWWVIALAVPMPSGRTWPQAVAFLATLLVAMMLTSTDDGERSELPVRVAPSGILVGVLALTLAAAAPGILPGYEQPAWTGLGGSSSNPRGYQPIVDISDRLQLPDERDVLRVQSSQRTYLRLAGLDTFDGATWRLGPPGEGSYRPDSSSLYSARDVLPPEQSAGRTEAVFVEVDVLELENIYVPAPYQPVEVLGDPRGDMVWSTEGGFLATWDTSEGELGGEDRVGIREGVNYSVQAARPTPTRDDLVDVEYDPEMLARWTQLPREYPALRDEAEAVYTAAGAEEVIDRVLALQDWFVGDGGGFTYDLEVPALRGEEALERFVLEDKVGYCEYFATAMAVMLRESGIPARVAVGFLPGRVTQEATGDRELTEYTVSTADAHAWVEVLFPGAGWVTFEPTPRSDESQTVPNALDLAPVESEAERREREQEELDEEGATDDPSSLPIPDDGVDLPDEPAPGEGATGAGEEEGSTSTVWFVILTLAAAATIVVLATRVQRRRLSRHDGTPEGRILAAQRRLLSTAARYGIGRRPEETATEVVSRWRAERRIDRRGAGFARTAQTAAFGGQVDEAVAHQAELLVIELETMLRESVPAKDRLMAPVRGPLEAARNGTRRAGSRLRQRA